MGSAFRVLNALLVGTITIAVPHTALADAIHGFEFIEDILAGETVQINWNLDGPRLQGLVRPFRSNDSITAQLDTPRQAAAVLFASVINARVGMQIASASGGTVRLVPGVTLASLDRGTTGGFLRIFTDFFDLNLAGLFMVSPDPGTGLAALVSPGTFAVTGPAGLNASFTAPAGTTISSLADIFGGVMASNGYSVNVTGAIVQYLPPEPGIVSFRVDGDGPEYAVTVVPEPAMLVLLGSGLIAIVVRAHRRYLICYLAERRPGNAPHDNNRSGILDRRFHS